MSLSTEREGESLQERMAPKGRKDIEAQFQNSTSPRISSVLILMFIKEGRLTIPVIERPDYEGVHAGQIAFPGGKKEEREVGEGGTKLVGAAG